MICPSCKALNDAAAEACFTCGRMLSALTQGDVIANRYKIESVLGKGGMGMVYRAHDRMLDETVAIKVLRGEFANTAEMAKRFRQEIRLARKVTHRNVCRIHEYGEDGTRRYISMEYVEGTDIKQLARDMGGLLDADEAFDVAVQAADGLQAIHDVGIIHRDLKTSNIMLDKSGRVRLMDFGIAKSEATDRGSGGGGLTVDGQVMGTPEYMSPEQCMGDRTINHQSDVYALGIVIYEIFTGTVPFRGDTPVATLFKHIQESVPFEGPLAARIPPSAVPVLRKALAKERKDRYPSAASLADALRKAWQETRDRVSADATPTARVAAVGPAAEAASPAATPTDRRRATRLDIPVNFMLRRLRTDGTVLQEERTFAENVGRGGARIVTSMTALAPGDIVHLEEIGGLFKTRAEVRGTYVGTDHVRRLNLHFLDSRAPDYLVHVDYSR
ncbi:MAG TPA: serine/threonine-protein kinase [Vicinamibacteria bacterium]|nr:serine/threonine-protein kinase [Vicinamibacteria bacterium]